VAADRRVGPHDDNFPVLADRSGGLGPGLDHSHDRDVRCRRDLVERKRGRSIAGDHQQLGSVGLKVVGGFNRVARHGFNRLRAVREAGSIAKVDVIGVRDKLK
jgi:hypothetical protein